MEFMIGPFKFTSENEESAIKKAKKIMISKGLRNLRLMKKYEEGWGVCRVIPSFEK